ncbi:SHOCT domain-containing protein [Companilactobacillus bobalius]|nr:hypothetical protein [Companilactobacillus bobalius]KAE9561675.1 hypothetical protein ATN92_06270 [Companilactobacillus bobalius]OVE98295.1 hypothetical protein LKACC16343_01182 [Companilactobacillus bobalius]GEO57663.1 hypothetical protein LBO01_07920 [Companilactobacillus paralimentarius]
MMGLTGCHIFSGMDFMGGGFLFYGIITLLIFIAIVYLFNDHQNSHRQNSALDILDREYAQGKISDADYAKRKENLKK